MLHAVCLVLVLLCICVFGVHFIGQEVLVVLSRWVAALAKGVLPGPSCCVCSGLFSHLLCVWWAVFPPAVVGSNLLAATCIVVARETAVLSFLFLSA